MGVDPADPKSPKSSRFEDSQNLILLREDCERERTQISHRKFAFREIATSKLSQHEGVNEHRTCLKECNKFRFLTAEMPNPDGAVHENHQSVVVRRRGTRRSFG